MSIRDIKRLARRKVHQTMGLPLLYITSANPNGTLIHARLHKNEGLTGQMRGLSMKLIEAFEESPKVIFAKSDIESANIELKKGDILSFLENEAYKIENFYPQDDEYRILELSRLTIAQANGVPHP